MADDALHTVSIEKSFGAHKVLTGVSIRAARGSVVALLGPNGAGKTTLVRILATLTRPDAGTAMIAGHDLLREPAGVRSSICVTGQYAAVDELLSGEENMRLLARLWRLPRRESQARVAELLNRFDLVEAKDRPVKTYSGGMRRRLDLALSIVRTPQVLFLDEPTTGLDPRSRSTVWATVRELADSGVTVLLTTQYLEEADRLADRIYMLAGGSVVAEGTPEELKGAIAGETARLHFDDRAAVIRAASVVGPGALGSTIDGNWLNVRTEVTVDDVRRILDQLALHGLTPSKLRIDQPTLDDVFLSLTDRRTPAMEVA